MTASAPRPSLLLVDDEPYVLESLRRLLSAEGFECRAASGVDAAMKILGAERVDVVVTDLSMPDADGIALVRRAREIDPALPVIVLTGVGNVAAAVAAMKAGALDFLSKPVEPDALIALVRRAIEHGALVDEVRSLRASVREFGGAPEIVGESAAMREVMRTVATIAPTDARILIFGESGTGKELVAHAIHAQSRRARKPFVRVNCAAIPESLFESEMFGHKKGSFTGATADRAGYFAEAHGGTIALDEIGTLRADAQAKVLRVIEAGEYQPLGQSAASRSDARVIAITNEDLEARVRAGTFREDLFFRLKVVPIVVPSLRARKGDIPLLVEHFLAALARRDGTSRKRLGAGALDVLASYDWPGNVRELRNAIERAVLLEPGESIEGAAFASILEAGMFTLSRGSAVAAADAVGADANLCVRDRTNALEKQLIVEALRRTAGRKKEASALLGIDARNFAYYVKKHGLGAADEGER